MSFDLNILDNGNKCKQHHFQGKTFIEAHNGSEYVIEIKNNHYKRILAVGSVDSLNVLTGKTATPNDSGYIIGAYSSEKIKGFRFSDDEWAMFKFGYKFYGNTYAQSKNDGSEKNCGVIGVKFFYEKEPVVVYSSPPVQWNVNPSWLTPSWIANLPSTTCCSISASWSTNSLSSAYNNNTTAAYSCGPHSTGGYQNNVSYTCNSLGQVDPKNYQSMFGGTGATKSGPISPEVNTNVKYDASIKCCASTKAEFDMGTEWGRKEHSKVNTIPFDKGDLAYSIDIYYASRESLIAMGVPITNALTSNLPQSFPGKYALPPKNWVG